MIIQSSANLLLTEDCSQPNLFKGKANMRKYKTEMHCHSAEISQCAEVTIPEIIEKYASYGYASLVLTNHLWSWDCKDDFDKYKKKVDDLFAACDMARELAGDRLHIINGVELALNDGNDYLLYGVTKEFLLSEENISALITQQLKDKANAAGIIVIHAHPLRFGQWHLPPEEIDGYEIYNGHPEAQSNNDAAEIIFSRLKGKILTSGTDHHYYHHIPRGGIATDYPITCMDDLINVLRSGEYSLIKDGQIAEC